MATRREKRRYLLSSLFLQQKTGVSAGLGYNTELIIVFLLGKREILKELPEELRDETTSAFDGTPSNCLFLHSPLILNNPTSRDITRSSAADADSNNVVNAVEIQQKGC